MEKFQLLVPIAWTVIMLIAYLSVRLNRRFTITFLDNNARVDPSPSLVWSSTKKISAVIGFILFALMWVLFFLVSNDAFVGLESERSNVGNYMIFGSAALSIVFFFAGYSSRLTNNFVVVDRKQIDAWENQGLIKEVRDNTFVDMNGDRLLHLFDNKEWV